MATDQRSGVATRPPTRDREFEEHLTALGLKTVEEYAEWCARHGFSVRTKKHWHQRCKERHFASQREIRTRCARRRRESRHPRTTIRRIASGELVPSELTQPHLVAISEALARHEGAARDAFVRLLLRVQDCADLFDTARVIPAYGSESGNTFIGALSALARQHRSWLRPVNRWKPRTHNPRRQFSSLARHLLATYPVPQFMDSVWFQGTTPEAIRRQGWFRQMADGKSPRPLDLPVRLTKRMVHHLLRAPRTYTVEAALRWAQVLGLGGSPPLVEAILGSKLAADFEHEDFWISVIRWLVAHPMLDRAHVAPIVDYIRHQKYEPQPADGAGANRAPAPPQPGFSIEGRTPASLLRRVREWHGALRKREKRASEPVAWHASGIGELDETESVADDVRRWTIREILTGKALFAEGCAMRHCVATYEYSCMTGRSSIWSLGIELPSGRRKRALTVEVDLSRGVICQARGKANRRPSEKELNVLRRWAAQESLTLAKHVESC